LLISRSFWNNPEHFRTFSGGFKLSTGFRNFPRCYGTSQDFVELPKMLQNFPRCYGTSQCGLELSRVFWGSVVGGGEGVDGQAEQGAVTGVQGSDPARERPVGPPVRTTSWFAAQGYVTPEHKLRQTQPPWCKSHVLFMYV